MITLNGSEVLVVVDYKNELLKTFSQFGNDELRMDGVPYRLCKLTNGKVALTFPLSREIQIISLQRMTVVQVIPTEKMYAGITSVPKMKNVLAVGTLREEPASIDFIDMKGSVLKSFQHDQFGNAICITPSFLGSTPSGDILISDHSMHALICISQKGDIQWRHQPHKGENFLEDPVGVACFNGDVFLVDRLKGCVFLFTHRGWCHGPVIETSNIFSEPFSICTDRKGTVYVGMGDGDIQVYPDGGTAEMTTFRTVIDLPRRQRIT
ncbi:uncharacterized protein LOC124291864 [Haliotis rubra]|uniref:uncharacterized protein LOC124291864 n=1 Tax=Haliotis rubra TaxID=36100 RepID=UPI001EE52787|nr:uncharacterized protein LOC124291864 [Haliotis rubra]